MADICKVLIVEDDPDIRNVFALAFTDDGYEVARVPDGAAAWSLLEGEDKIDAAVIDIMLPSGPDGFALARAASRRGLAVILVTGDHRHAERLAICDHRYLLKPFSPSSLVAAVRHELARARRECNLDRRAAVDA